MSVYKSERNCWIYCDSPMAVITGILCKIRRRIIATEQVIVSGNEIDRETREHLFQSIDSTTKKLLRLEGHVPTDVFEGLLSDLQVLRRNLIF